MHPNLLESLFLHLCANVSEHFRTYMFSCLYAFVNLHQRDPNFCAIVLLHHNVIGSGPKPLLIRAFHLCLIIPVSSLLILRECIQISVILEHCCCKLSSFRSFLFLFLRFYVSVFLYLDVIFYLNLRLSVSLFICRFDSLILRSSVSRSIHISVSQSQRPSISLCIRLVAHHTIHPSIS